MADHDTVLAEMLVSAGDQLLTDGAAITIAFTDRRTVSGVRLDRARVREKDSVTVFMAETQNARLDMRYAREGLKWIRGHHHASSAAGQALIAAYLLTSR